MAVELTCENLCLCAEGGRGCQSGESRRRLCSTSYTQTSQKDATFRQMLSCSREELEGAEHCRYFLGPGTDSQKSALRIFDISTFVCDSQKARSDNASDTFAGRKSQKSARYSI